MYKPIENYGAIGDLNTIALAGLDGSIDFLCYPDFDSPSIFARLLDEHKGGYFQICAVHDAVRNKQLYLPDTNVLLTRFMSPEGVGELTDFMPVDDTAASGGLVRSLACVRGSMAFKMEFRPRFDYGRTLHKVLQKSSNEIQFICGETAISLRSTHTLELDGTDAICLTTLQFGEHITFYMGTSGATDAMPVENFLTQSLYATINYWKGWIAESKYSGKWSEIVNRSALILKLMTSRKYGSIVASPTFGLPEEIGGERNWDYRYTWIRDASFTVYALINLGYKKEAREFMSWVEKRCDDIGEAGNLSLMYSLDGKKDLFEKELPHLEGYEKSKPVRIGNGAYDQVQLDIYGELLDAVYLFDKHVERISYNFWLNISRQIDWLSGNWDKEDEGIWEVRGGKRKFLYSRLMCWVAMDRALKIAYTHSYPVSPKWLEARDTIFHSIHNEFWNEELKSFVQYKGADTIDAATLLMPLVRFIGPTDPKWLSTLRRIEEDLVSDSMVYRYRQNGSLDGLKGSEGTFSMCTFWFVECLSKAGQLNKARLFFEKMLGYANHLGLYSEMLGVQGEHLGNFPQAFTHLGLISAALSLDHQFDDQRNKEQ